MTEMEITVRTRIHPTESRENIEETLHNIFPDAEFEHTSRKEEGIDSTEVLADAGEDSVERLRELIDRQEINETAYEKLHEAKLGDTVSFSLSKQPAAVGRLNFDVGGHELGAIDVRIETDDPGGLIGYVTGN